MKIGKALLHDIMEFDANDGTLAFWWLGQLGYAIKSKSALIMIDPFLSEHPGRRIPPLLRADDLSPADYILGTHDHTDHIDRAAWADAARLNPRVKFIVPEAHISSLSSACVIDRTRLIGLNDATVFRDDNIGLAVSGIAAAHEFLDRDPESGLYPALGYVIGLNGFRIYHSGDCCIYEGLTSSLLRAGPFDLMFLPINGRDGARYRAGIIGNMDFREAADLAGTLKPSLVVPGHYEMFENNREDPMAFVEYLEAKYPDQAFYLGAHGEKVVLTK